jgi:hypothetical protein
MKMKIKMISFVIFSINRAPMEWNWQGKTEVLGEKTCLSATLPTTNPTWTDLGSNPGLRGERPATNRLSHCTAPGNGFNIPYQMIKSEHFWRDLLQSLWLIFWTLNISLLGYIAVFAGNLYIFIATKNVANYSLPALGPIQPGTGGYVLWGKRPWCEVHCSRKSSVKVKHHGVIPPFPHVFMAWWLINYPDGHWGPSNLLLNL